MGRLDHLTRLGLGRSAFQPLHMLNTDGGDAHVVAGAQTNDAEAQVEAETQATSPSRQQYDSKGRPMNAAADRLNADLRYAQNKVLELAKIVERKQDSNRSRHVHAHMHGSMNTTSVDIFADLTSFLLCWYPQTMLERFLLGIYSTETPIAGIVAMDLADVKAHSLVNVFFPGLGLYAGYSALTVLVARATQRIVTTIMGSTSGYRFALTLAVSSPVVAQVCLWPILHLAVATRLGLVRSTSLASVPAMLTGFYRLCYGSLIQLDTNTLSTTQALPLLSGISAIDLTVLMQPALRTRNARCTADSSLADLRSGMPNHRFPSNDTYRQARLHSLEVSGTSRNTERDQRLAGDDYNRLRVSCKEDRRRVCRYCQTTRSAALWNSSNMVVAAVLTKLLRLPLDFVVLTTSARSFNNIIGPGKQSDGKAMPPIQSNAMLLGKFREIDLRVVIAVLCKASLAIGFTLAIDFAVRTAFHAIVITREAQARRQRDRKGT